MKTIYKLTLVITLLISMVQLNAQTPYYDALYLKDWATKDFENIPKESINNIAAILSKYLPKNQININSITTIDNFKSDNPFFSDYFKHGEKTAQGSGYNLTSALSSLKSGFSSVGGLDVTNLSKGLSLFLIDRAKEELTIAFFEKFKNYIDKNKELKILFPNTSDRVVNLLGYQYTDMLLELQKAFKKDMATLPENLIEVLLLPKYYDKFKDAPGFIVLLNSYNLIKQINLLSAAQIVDSLPNIAIVKGRKIDTNLYGVLKLSSIFSNSIRNNDATRNWISYSNFYKTVLKDSICFNIFLGLVYQQIKTENIEINGENIATLIQDKDKLILYYKNQISKLEQITEKIDTAYLEIKSLKKDGKKLDNINYSPFLDHGFSNISFSF